MTAAVEQAPSRPLLAFARRTVRRRIPAAASAIVLIVGSGAGAALAVAGVNSTAHDNALRSAQTSYNTARQAAALLQDTETTLHAQTLSALTYRDAVQAAITGQDSYLGSGPVAQTAAASDKLAKVLAAITTATTAPADGKLVLLEQPESTMPVAVKASSTTDALTSAATALHQKARALDRERQAIDQRLAGVVSARLDLEVSVGALAAGLPAAEQQLAGGNPLAGAANTGAAAAAAQTAATAADPSTLPVALGSYVAAAKGVQASQAAAAAASAAAAAQAATAPATHTGGGGARPSTGHTAAGSRTSPGSSASSGSSSGSGTTAGSGGGGGTGGSVDTARHVQVNSHYVAYSACQGGGTYYAKQDPGPGGTSVATFTFPWTYQISGDWIYFYAC